MHEANEVTTDLLSFDQMADANTTNDVVPNVQVDTGIINTQFNVTGANVEQASGVADVNVRDEAFVSTSPNANSNEEENVAQQPVETDEHKANSNVVVTEPSPIDRMTDANATNDVSPSVMPNLFYSNFSLHQRVLSVHTFVPYDSAFNEH